MQKKEELKEMKDRMDSIHKILEEFDTASFYTTGPTLEFDGKEYYRLSYLAVSNKDVNKDVAEYYEYVVAPLIRERYTRGEEKDEVDVFDRVALYLASTYDEYNSFFTMMKNRLFLPSSPTLMNAGMNRGTLSSCFVIIPDDDMESITDYWSNMAMVQKYGGGVGTDWSAIRPAGLPVMGTSGVSSGFAPFLSVANEINSAIKQGSARSGANASTMRYDHPEIMKFIDFKRDDPSKFGFFNLSVTFDDEGFKKCMAGEDIPLVFDGTVFETINGRRIIERMAENAWLTGDPSPYFLDRTNSGFWEMVSGKSNGKGGVYRRRISHNPCVTGDTLIATDKGMMPIAEAVGKNLLVVCGDGSLSDNDGVVLTRRNAEVYKVVFDNGMVLKATPDHKISVVGKGMVRVDDLKDGDEVEYAVNGLVNKSTEGSFDEGYVAGFLKGAGEVYDGVAKIWFYHHHKKYLGYVMFYINQLGIDFFHSYHLDRDEDYISFRAEDIKFTENPLSKSREYIRGFLTSYFASSGEVHYRKGKRHYIVFSSHDIEFLRELQLMLMSLGVYSMVGDHGQTGIDDETIAKSGFTLVIPDSSLRQFLKFVSVHNTVYDNSRLDNRFGLTGNWEKNPLLVQNVITGYTEDVYDVINTSDHLFYANFVKISNCGEQNLVNWGVCNLGSVNLMAVSDINGEVNYELLEAVIRLGVRFLDNVIDENFYHNDKIKHNALRLRNIGLGVMGLADVLYLKNIRYGSDEAVDFTKRIMSFITVTAAHESIVLGKEKGVAPVFEGTDIKFRNSDITCVAPTGSISLLALCNNGIEPFFSHSYDKLIYPKGEFNEGKYITIRPPIFMLRPDLEKPATSHDITPMEHLKMLSAVSHNVTNAVSKTVNLPKDSTVDDIIDIYAKAFDMGIKSLSVFRDGCREDLALVVNEERVEECCVSPDHIQQDGCTKCLACGWSACKT